MARFLGLSQVAVEGRKNGVTDDDVNVFTIQASFSTLTNVDFDPERFVLLIKKAAELRDGLKAKLAGTGFPEGPASFTPAADLAGVDAGEAPVNRVALPGDLAGTAWRSR